MWPSLVYGNPLWDIFPPGERESTELIGDEDNGDVAFLNL